VHSIPMPTFFVRLFKVLIALLLPLVIVIGSVRLLVTDRYLAFEYSKIGFPPDRYGFDQAQRLAYASANFRYVREAQSPETMSEQQLGYAPLYNARELKHMQDVQNVYQAVWWVWQLAFSLVLLVGFALAWRRVTRPALYTALRWGGLLTAGIVGLIGGLAVVAWQLWFVAFHQVFFATGTWTFEYTDTLIRLFPEKFWFDAALTIAGISAAGGLAVALAGWRLQPRPAKMPVGAYIIPSRS